MLENFEISKTLRQPNKSAFMICPALGKNNPSHFEQSELKAIIQFRLVRLGFRDIISAMNFTALMQKLANFSTCGSYKFYS